MVSVVLMWVCWTGSEDEEEGHEEDEEEEEEEPVKAKGKGKATASKAKGKAAAKRPALKKKRKQSNDEVASSSNMSLLLFSILPYIKTTQSRHCSSVSITGIQRCQQCCCTDFPSSSSLQHVVLLLAECRCMGFGFKTLNVGFEPLNHKP